MIEKKYHNQDLSNYSFLVTGGAGFIGSNIVEYLLKFNAKFVRVLDNLSTGHLSNLEQFKTYKNFEFIEGDIRNLSDCKIALSNIDYVYHEAALGSVPRSIEDPITTNNVNITGFLNLLCAIKDNNTVKRVVYAASSSTYGDLYDLPKFEDKIGKPLSPYAVTKYVNELYADVFYKNYNIETIGLRYFNVFGKRQDPNSAYSAVIPKFIKQFIQYENPIINGDGTITRDFTYIDNIIQINILAMFTENKFAINNIFNAAYGESISLNELCFLLKKYLSTFDKKISEVETINRSIRKGDIMHSLASIEKAKEILNYNPFFSVEAGIKETISWYFKNSN